MPYCPSCGADVAASARFCSACGTALAPGSGAISTGDVTGTGIAIGTGASARVHQGVQVEALARLLGGARALIDEREDDPAVDKAQLRRALDAVEAEAAKGEKADGSKLRRVLQWLAQTAPDVLAVTSAALLNPLTGVAEGVRRIAAAMAPTTKEQG